MDRLLILARVGHYAVDLRKTAVDLTTNRFRDLGAARWAKRRMQTGQNRAEGTGQ